MCQIIILGMLNTTYLILNTTYQNSKKHVFKRKLWNALFDHANLKWLLPNYNVSGSGRDTNNSTGLPYTT